MALKTKTPLRISWAGGGTDILAVREKTGGRVLNSTITSYVDVDVYQNHDPKKLSLSYREGFGRADYANELKHLPTKHVLMHEGVLTGLEIHSHADIPREASGGLGGSSSYIVGLINAVRAFCDLGVTRESLAKTASIVQENIQTEELGAVTGGMQDQYAAAYGGINIFKFDMDGTVSRQPIDVDMRQTKVLNEHLFLIVLPLNRPKEVTADSILRKQSEAEALSKNLDNYRRQADLVPEAERAIRNGDMQELGRILREGNKLKQEITNGAVPNGKEIEKFLTVAMENGALGVKLAGAGGGGSMSGIVPPENRGAMMEALSSMGCLEEPAISIEFDGSRVVYNDGLHRLRR